MINSRLRSTWSAGSLVLALSLPVVAQSPLCTIDPTVTASNNGGGVGGAIYFDLNLTAGLRVTGIDSNFSAAAGNAVGIEIWTCPGSYVGNETNLAAWTQVGVDDGTSLCAGRNLLTSFTLANPVVLTPGSMGVALIAVGSAHAYRGTGSTPYPGGTYSDAFATITTGGASNTPWATGWFQVREWMGCLHYTPAAGLYSSFSASVQIGPSPLTVQFTDTSYSSDPNGVLAWQWDFDNDGTIDSTQQNPSHTYTTGGSYTVSLEAIDGLTSVTETKPDFIVVDPITADFTAAPSSGAVPLIVQFTDTSVGNPISWAWDFNNDGAIDDIVQNPVWPYVNGGRYTVSLTVTNAWNLDTVTKTDLILALGATENTRGAEILEYKFNEPRGAQVANAASTTVAPAFGTVQTNGGAPNENWRTDAGRTLWQGEAGTGCLAIDNVSPYESRVDSGWVIDMTGSYTISFWCRSGGTGGASYAFGSSTGSGRCYYTGGYMSLRSWGNLGFIDMATDLDVLSGWQHCCVVIDDQAGVGQWYLNGVPDGSALAFTPGTFTFQAGNFTVGTYGTTTSYFTRYFDMDDFRVYGRALTPTEIMASMASENPAATNFGSSCAGPMGTPTIQATGGAPELGNSAFRIEADNLEAGRPQAIFLSFTATAGGILPLDMSPLLGASYAGCRFEVLPSLLSVPLPSGTAGGVNLTLSTDPILAGLHIYAQAIVGGSVGAVSNALDVHIQM